MNQKISNKDSWGLPELEERNIHPAKMGKEDWQWRTPFKTRIITFGDELSKEEIFAGLDECLVEIQQFEADLKEKLG